MNNKKTIAYLSIIFFLTTIILLANIVNKQTLIEKYNIKPDEELFKVIWLKNGEEIYNTGNVSWNWLVDNGYIRGGQLYIDRSYVKSKLKELDAFNKWVDYQIDVFVYN